MTRFENAFDVVVRRDTMSAEKDDVENKATLLRKCEGNQQNTADVDGNMFRCRKRKERCAITGEINARKLKTCWKNNLTVISFLFSPFPSGAIIDMLEAD